MNTVSPTKGAVLLVDDDKFLVEMYASKFVREGFTVQACISVGDALEHLRHGFAADAIIFDLVMPERDGFSFLEALSSEKLATNAVKIALTNQGEEVEKTRTMSLGADMYIVKASKIPSEVVNIASEEIARRKHT